MDSEEHKTDEESVDTVERKETIEIPLSEKATVPETQEPTEQPVVHETGFKAKLISLKTAYLAKKKLFIPVTIILLLGIIFGLPLTRYPLLGIALKKDLKVTVIDSKTNKPVSSVDVKVVGKTAKTGQDGVATFSKIPVGRHQIQVSKKYYQDQQGYGFVGISGKSDTQLSINATGRQVKVYAFNRLNGKPLKDAKFTAAGTEATTDEKGNATIVLPPSSDTQEAVVSHDGFLDGKLKIKIIESETADNENSIGITPQGKIYFLSKRTGKINVMKSNLDGSDAQVVLNATGNEDERDTVLLASQDWKYLALKSKRNAADKPASLYLIDTTQNDKLITMDEGNAEFTMAGWSGHNFVYQVQRTSVQYWQPNKASLKAYSADKKTITVIDNTSGEGTGAQTYYPSYGTDQRYESIDNVILVDGKVAYTKTWYSGTYSGPSTLGGKQDGIYVASVDSNNRSQIKSFDATTTNGISAKLYHPKEVYFQVYVSTKNTPDFYELEDGKVTSKGDLTSQFNSTYPTFLASPSGTKTFWSESRDGKNTLFIGDNNGGNEKTVSELSDYNTYGWYTDDYVLLSRNSSELFIIGSSDKLDYNFVTKITDYHKPATVFYGYSGGYGGF